MIKKTLSSLVALAVLLNQPHCFASILGTGGASEVTQIANNVQLTLQYIQQIQQYVRQGLQLQNELQNLQRNPFSLMGSDVGNVINGVGKIMSGTNAIGANLAQIDRNFATKFGSPTAATLSANFRNWHATNLDTLQGVLKSAGMHRDQFSSDTDAIRALYDESQSSDGNLKALQTLSKINAKQLEQTQVLQSLLTEQNIATSTYMATQSSRDAESKRQLDVMSAPYNPDLSENVKAPPPDWTKILYK